MKTIFDPQEVFLLDAYAEKTEVVIMFNSKKLSISNYFSHSCFFDKNDNFEIVSYNNLFRSISPLLPFNVNDSTKEKFFKKLNIFFSNFKDDFKSKKNILELKTKYLNEIMALDLEKYAINYESKDKSIEFCFKFNDEFKFYLEMDTNLNYSRQLVVITKFNNYNLTFTCNESENPKMIELVKRIVNIDKFRIRFLLDGKYNLFKLD